MGSHKNFYLNTFWQYMLQLIKYLLPLLVMPYLTRVLEPSGYAVYAYVVSFMAFAQTLVDFGFNLSGVHQIAEACTTEDEDRIVGAITQARLLLCILSAVIFSAIGFFIPIIRDNFVYSALSFVAVCARSLAPDFLFQGREKMGPLTTRYLISKGVFVVLVFMLVHGSSDLLIVPVIDIVTSSIALIWSFMASRRIFGVWIRFVSMDVVLDELKRSACYCASNIASTSLSGATTLILGVAINDAREIGYWSVAMTAISAVQSLYSPIINSLYPHLVVQKDRTFAKRLFALSIPFVSLGSILFYSLIDWLVLILGGEAYLPGAYVLRLLFPIVPISFYCMLFGWPVLGVFGQVKKLTQSTISCTAVSVILLLAAWLFGATSISIYAVIRVLSELLLFLFRGATGLRILCEKPRDGKNDQSVFT